jgi:hypothetical protein
MCTNFVMEFKVLSRLPQKSYNPYKSSSKECESCTFCIQVAVLAFPKRLHFGPRLPKKRGIEEVFNLAA